QILPAVVIEIDDGVGPAGHRPGQIRECALVAAITELALAFVEEEGKRLVFDRRVPDVRQTVVVHVAEVSAHARESSALVVVGDACLKTDLLKSLSSDVAEE